ncbi:MAG TPA: MFS transporter [Flavobacteriaceae bacterium]|nr:MFS transporter [Flavobacteriaceae bacterium]
MFSKTIKLYKDSFSGLSTEVWWLSIITFINRAGTMVLPFLSLYLTEELKLSLSDVGWIMTSFGLGSLAGSWLGGKLTDKVGYYPVMFWSLLLTGFMFLGLQYVKTFWGFTLALFATMVIADAFRPALFVSLKAYSKLENQTRSLSLIRLAINLGFSLGPFVGGIIITSLGYTGLFWVDGITCILAILVMRMVVKPKPFRKEPDELKLVETTQKDSIYKDKLYWLFLTIVFIMGFIFLQLFTTIPLYYNDVHNLSELKIGLIMSLNGFLIFLLEMPLVHTLEKSTIDRMKIITWSIVLMALSFLVLNTTNWIGILIVGILLITIGEMLAFPFTNNFAMNRGPKGKEGSYLAWYTMAFSVAHIFSAKTGMEIIDKFGYITNWFVMGGLGLIAVILLVFLKQALQQEKLIEKVETKKAAN